MTTPKILIIDDDLDMQRLLKLYLKMSGFDTVECTNGLEAQALVLEGGFQLVISDLMMPGFDGIQFLRWLRQECKSMVPVIVCSSMSDKKTIDQVMSLGAGEYCRKPFRMDVLIPMVKGLLAKAD